MIADYVFTLPGTILILVSGLVMAVKANLAMSGFNWLTLPLILFSITGVLWIFLLIPLQRKMIRISAQLMRIILDELSERNEMTLYELTARLIMKHDLTISATGDS
jgi:uncharacterized membrane protein